MLGQINEWFFHDLAGIATDPSAPGFKNILIQPAIVGDLAWVKGRYDSVRGPITTEWRREGGRLTLNLTIPPNSTATVFVPAQRAEDVTEGGVAASKSPHVGFLRQEKGSAVYSVASGTYRFVVFQFGP
jgi:hypothetical protein